MQAFYTHLNQFLVAAGLEVSTRGMGCSEVEIAAQEQAYGVAFPLAYRLFLTWCGRAKLQSLDQDFRLAFLDYYWESARELLAEHQAVLEPTGFVFSEWQGYSFWYFLPGSDNPAVKLCSIKSDQELGLANHEYGRFTDWLIGQLKALVQLRQSLGRIDAQVSAVWAELDQIAKLADKV